MAISKRGMRIAFPSVLLLIGITFYIAKGRFSALGIILSLSTMTMFSGLLIAPWIHHVGIILVASCLIVVDFLFRAEGE